jgi:hypothetical protein
VSGFLNQFVWVILAGLAYLLVTCILMVLASARKRAIEIHDRVRECMELRRQYMTSVEEAKNAK